MDQPQTAPSAFERRMAGESIPILMIRNSIPPIIGMLVNALYNVVDRFWVGRIPGIGRDALTGLGLCLPVMNVLMGFCMLLGIGAATRISISLGRGDRGGAEHILGNTLAFVAIFAAIITAAAMAFAEPILTAMGADATIMPHALEYYRIIIAGYIFQMLSFSMNHPIRAAGNTARFASSQLVGGVGNMILDPIFIFVFDMGIAGAAFATILAQALSASWVLSYYYTKGSPLKLRLKYIKPVKAIALSIFSIGMSPFLMQIATSCVTIAANRVLKHYGGLELSDGNIAIGAMTVIQSVSLIFMMPQFGLNQGTQPIVGYNYGAKNYARVKEAYKWSMIYTSFFCVAGFIVTQLFSAQLVSMFNDDPELVAVGAYGMRRVLSCIIFVGLQIPSINFFQSVGRAKMAVSLSLLRQVVILIPAYFILPMFLGLNGIWLAAPFADTVACVITLYFIYTEMKKLGTEG